MGPLFRASSTEDVRIAMRLAIFSHSNRLNARCANEWNGRPPPCYLPRLFPSNDFEKKLWPGRSRLRKSGGSRGSELERPTNFVQTVVVDPGTRSSKRPRSIPRSIPKVSGVRCLVVHQLERKPTPRRKREKNETEIANAWRGQGRDGARRLLGRRMGGGQPF